MSLSRRAGFGLGVSEVQKPPGIRLPSQDWYVQSTGLV